jgi:hypothetical protein
MPVVHDRHLACPRCGEKARHQVALSVDAARSPAARRAILDGSFQRYTCRGCRAPYHADGPMHYLDYRRRHWIAVYPREREAGWRAVEEEAVAEWRRATDEHAPPMLRRAAGGFVVRVVFGMVALRDKLVGLDDGLDDAVVEALKLDLARSVPELALHPEERLHLARADARSLRFTAPPPVEGPRAR